MLRELVGRLEQRDARIAIVGQGYVGLPLAMRAAELGFSVTGYDVDAGRVDALRAGLSYVEDVNSEQLRAATEAGYRATTDPAELAGFDVAVITVPTPLQEGVPDLSFIETAAGDLVPHLRPGVLVVLESTTYPGTTEELLRPALEQSGRRAGTDFFLGYSPERVDPGNPKWSLANTPKVVSGIDDDSLAAVTAFYSRIVDTVVPVGSTAEAELVKLLENTFRHVNIALVNELAVFAEAMGIDVWEAMEAAATKGFGYMAFTPGPGVGGHCLPIDPSYLAWRVEQQLGHRFRFVELANDVNGGMPDYVVRRVQALLNDHARSVKGSRILLIGLAYKAGTSDWRESPATTVAQRLSELGAEVRAHDAHVPDDAGLGPEVKRVDCSIAELEAADLVVILTAHADLPYDDIAEHARLVLDTRGSLRGRSFRGQVL